MTKSRKSSSEETFANRWSLEVMAQGFFMKPGCLMRCLADLDLSPNEAVVLDYLFSYWYDYSNRSNVYPAAETIGKDLNMGKSTVARHIRCLEIKGFLKREFRQGTTNVYHLTPSILKIREHVLNTHPLQKRGGYYSNMGRQPPPELSSKEERKIRGPNQNNLKKIGDLINERYK